VLFGGTVLSSIVCRSNAVFVAVRLHTMDTISPCISSLKLLIRTALQKNQISPEVYSNPPAEPKLATWATLTRRPNYARASLWTPWARLNLARVYKMSPTVITIGRFQQYLIELYNLTYCAQKLCQLLRVYGGLKILRYLISVMTTQTSIVCKTFNY